jgi:hypothetical protein
MDVYAKDLVSAPDAVSLIDAHLDKFGYYSAARWDLNNNCFKDRQMGFFCGLRWRFEEFTPIKRRKIDRIEIFRAKTELHLKEDFTFNEQR